MIRCLLVVLTTVAAASDRLPTAAVGIPVQVQQLVLPGSLLEVKPLEDRQAALVVRVVAAYPHGDAFRYDLEYYALEPGTHRLTDYLQRADGSSTADLPPLEFEATSSLPPGQVQPHALSPGRLPGVGGYRQLLVFGGVIWCIGFLAILLVRRRRQTGSTAESATSESLEQRLENALQAAAAGTLDDAQRAELERMVLAHWRQQLGLESVDAPQAMAAMRADERARKVLETLEQWLHHPAGRSPEDFRRLVMRAGGSPSAERDA